MPPKKVSGDIIVQQFGDLDLTVEKLTAIQQAGMRIALFVGIVATLVTAAILLQWRANVPDFPALPLNPADALQIGNAKLVLEHYKSLSDLAFDGPAKLFDMIIVKVLYPLLTLVLGYVFGSRVVATNTESH